MTKRDQTALIIGASRGLGLGLVREYLHRGWSVIATVRNAGHPADLAALAARNEKALRIESVDINDPKQIEELRQHLAGDRLDVMFVNAGVANGPDETVAKVSTEEFHRVLVTNALSPMRFIERFGDLVKTQGVIAVMSSELGSVADNESGGWEVYRASKAALNTLMRSYAARTAGVSTLLTVAPGWVRTDMGSSAAPLDVETSIRGVVDMIEARTGTPGLVFANYRNEVVPW